LLCPLPFSTFYCPFILNPPILVFSILFYFLTPFPSPSLFFLPQVFIIFSPLHSSVFFPSYLCIVKASRYQKERPRPE
jgi:hypothetical protein